MARLSVAYFPRAIAQHHRGHDPHTQDRMDLVALFKMERITGLLVMGQSVNIRRILPGDQDSRHRTASCAETLEEAWGHW